MEEIEFELDLKEKAGVERPMSLSWIIVTGETVLQVSRNNGDKSMERRMACPAVRRPNRH